ncbi:MAG: hypothetical protein ACLP1Q_19880 [Solirubrobacteraceae bacterium]
MSSTGTLPPTDGRDWDDGLWVKQEARPMEMRLFPCHEHRMLRALHGRWPYRRSHCRHDLHWLVRVQSQGCWCPSARTHSVLGLRACSRRPQGR